jgi:hypothetical protein
MIVAPITDPPKKKEPLKLWLMSSLTIHILAVYPLLVADLLAALPSLPTPSLTFPFMERVEATKMGNNPHLATMPLPVTVVDHHVVSAVVVEAVAVAAVDTTNNSNRLKLKHNLSLKMLSSTLSLREDRPTPTATLVVAVVDAVVVVVAVLVAETLLANNRDPLLLLLLLSQQRNCNQVHS